MDPDRWKKIKEIFAEASELPVERRMALFETLDNEIRVEVEALLENFDRAESFIESPAAANFVSPDDSMLGREIDGYRIVEEIGVGGMGAVYLADQHADDLTHQVAFKVIKRGMDTNSVLKRFVKERQILANLEHPNIARFLDGGSTPEGLPYFVMEYVDGEPIKRYCVEHEMSTSDVLKLFRKVCAAVSYAHQNLTVHRDLKPSNILVTRFGEPKLLDFGIAKLLNPDWALDTAEATLTMFRAMTPDYASPEQMQGQNVTTASDVYSLGVVLYELLTGKRPFKNSNFSPQDLVEERLSIAPLRPSSVVSEHSETDRKTGRNARTTAEDPDRVAPENEWSETGHGSTIRSDELRGDIDNIVLKALQSDPARRYQSAAEFSEDIRRHLVGLPVTATADTFTYRFSKFVRRHRKSVAIAAAAVIVLLASTAVTAWQAYRAEREKARAEQRFNDVRRVANSFMFDIHDAIKDLPGSTEARSLVVQKALEYLEMLAAENSSDPTLLYELGTAFSKIGRIQGSGADANLGDSTGAMKSYKRANDILEPLVVAEPSNTEYLETLGINYIDMTKVAAERGDIDEMLAANKRAGELYGKLIELLPERVDIRATASDTYKSQGDFISSRGDLSEALRFYRLASETTAVLLVKEPENDFIIGRKLTADEAIAATLGNPNYSNLGQTAEATELYRGMLELSKRRLERKPTDMNTRASHAYFLENLGILLGASGDWNGALRNQDEALAIQKTIADPDPKNAVAHWRMANMLTDRGEALAKLRRFPESIAMHREAIAIFEGIIAKDPDQAQLTMFLARSQQRYADAMAESGKNDEARALYEKAIAINQPMADEDAENMDIRWALSNDYLKLARLLAVISKTDTKLGADAIENYRRSRAVFVAMKEKGLSVNPVLDSIASIDREISELGGS